MKTIVTFAVLIIAISALSLMSITMLEVSTRQMCGEVKLQDYVSRSPDTPAKCLQRWQKGEL